MRTIPIAESLEVTHGVSTFDEVKHLINEAKGPFVILECIYVKKKAIEGETCKVTERMERCLVMDEFAQLTIQVGVGREITRDEAHHIREKHLRKGGLDALSGMRRLHSHLS